MQVSDQDYLPDNESSGDESGWATVEKADKQLKGGKSELSRNFDNEFVFDKDWAFRRKCSLQSLLSARLLTLTYETKSLELPVKNQHGEGCQKDNHSCNAEKNCKPSCCNKSKKMQNGTRRRAKSEVEVLK